MPALQSYLLFAERSMFRDMASGIRDRREHFDPLDLLPWVVVAVVLIGGLALLSRYLNRQDKRRLYNNPRALFRTLCKAHDLDRPSRRLLKQLAKAHDITEPAQLFLDPERFDVTLLGSDLRRQQPAIVALGRKLFAQEPRPRAAAAAEGAAPPPTPPAPAAATAQAASKPAAAPASHASPRGAASKAAVAKAPSATAKSADDPLIGQGGSLPEKAQETSTSMAEQQAVKELETLMRQINSSRAAGSADASPLAGAHLANSPLAPQSMANLS